jgi:hypothetical protein
LLIRLVDQDGNASEGVAPLTHRGVEVRVGDDDAVEPTTCSNGLDGLVRDEADAFPENVARVGWEQQRPLIDRERRRHAQRQQAIVCLDALGEALAQLPVRRPSLAVPAHVLAFVVADGAAQGRAVGISVLSAAGLTDVLGHTEEHSSSQLVDNGPIEHITIYL